MSRRLTLMRFSGGPHDGCLRELSGHPTDEFSFPDGSVYERTGLFVAGELRSEEEGETFEVYYFNYRFRSEGNRAR